MSDGVTISKQCEIAAKIISSWPVWKRNLLRWYCTPNHSPEHRRQPVYKDKEPAT